MSAWRAAISRRVWMFGAVAALGGCRCDSELAPTAASAPATGTATSPPAPSFPDRNGDPLPAGAVERLGSARLRHTRSINTVVFSPDGATLLSAGDDHAIHLWRVDDGRELASLDGHDAPVKAAAFVDGGERVLSIDQRRTVRLWNVKTRTSEVVLQGSLDLHVYKAAISSGGAVWWSKTPEGSGSWSLRTRSLRDVSDFGGSTAVAGDARGVVLESQPGGERKAFLGSLDGPKTKLVELGSASVHVGAAAVAQSLVATGARDGTVELFAGGSGTPLRKLGELGGRVTALTFSRDEASLLALCDDRVATLFATRGGPARWSVRIADGEISSSALSPDGRFAAIADGNVVVLIDAANGAVVRPAAGHRSAVQALAFSPDGNEVIAGAHDGVILRWDVTMAEPLASYRSGFPVSSLAIAPDGGSFAVNIDRDVGVFAIDASRPRISTGHPARVTAVAFADQDVVSGDDDGHLFRWSSDGARIATRYPAMRSGIGAVAVSPDAAFIAATAAGVPSNKLGALTIFDRSTARVVRELSGHDEWATAAAFSPDGSRLASAGWDSRVRGFDVATGTELFNGKAPREIRKILPGALAFTVSGHVALANDAGGLALFDPSGAELEQERREVDAASVAASPDGGLLAVGAWDGTILLYRAP